VKRKLFSIRITALFLLLPGSAFAVAPLDDQNDIYSADRPNQFSDVVKNYPQIAYVPNHTSNTLTEIGIKSMKVIATYKMKKGPQHVVPS